MASSFIRYLARPVLTTSKGKNTDPGIECDPSGSAFPF
jgi:hypothetical protein